MPLWVAGAAKSALKKLVGVSTENYELIKVRGQKKPYKIAIHSVGFINGGDHTLGISFANSGLDLDLTRNLEIWVVASFEKDVPKRMITTNSINIIPGYGVGVEEKTSKICISNFARELLYENLMDIVPENFRLNLEIIFPKGKFLAERTSNKSFGIVDGLSIIGTSAETYASASPDQLKNAKTQLDQVIENNFKGKIVFVIGENGLNLAKNYDFQFPIIKVGNWLGPLLVKAAIKKVEEVILFGYHGKLIKLAGGIFHTHNHLADGRIETLVYLAVKEKVPMTVIMQLSQSSTVEEAWLIIEKFSKFKAEKLWNQLAKTVEEKSFAYVNRYIDSDMKICAIIFDRQRKVRWAGENGKKYISYFKND